MKIILIPFILLSLIMSCNKKENLIERENLYGEWYFNDNPDITLEFTKDSLIIRSYLSKLNNWEIDKNQIILSNSTTTRHDSLDPIEFPKNKNTILLSSNLDTLYWNEKRSNFDRTFKYLKLNDRFEYYQKIKWLTIDLPHSNNILEPLTNDNFSIDLRVGYRDSGELALNLGYERKLGQIEHLRGMLMNFLVKLQENEIDRVNVNMIIHKNLSQSYIDSLNRSIKSTGVNNIYRVYKNDSTNYKDNLDWKGIME